AQKISQGVVDNFLLMQTNMNQQTQSLLVKFLNSRIDTAKKESDEAAQKLADYSKEQKMYSPDDQAKEAITELAAYDKAIADMQVSQESARTEYETATQKLGEQKAGAKAYAINDNGTVQSIRSQIVAKEVELVGIKQKYTEEHPDVQTAEKQLKELNDSLVNEVNTVVASNAASLNTAQMALVQSQAVAAAKLAAASASETAIQEKLAEKEAEMESFPDKVMNYLNLERDAKIKQEVYINLVQQCEQNKIQEAMESMDIQIIDPANLPDEDKPSAPRRKLISAVGFVIGCLISFGYSLVLYRKVA
ncbi:MAG: chain-length determining protein, partial [Selenomonadaceae bacterium]|nr:chain-length determining protein [Selenomonadaceae bacterium]